MPSQHAQPDLISWRSKDPTLRQWIRDEAERRGVDQKVLLDDALAEYREKHDPNPTSRARSDGAVAGPIPVIARGGRRFDPAGPTKHDPDKGNER